MCNIVSVLLEIIRSKYRTTKNWIKCEQTASAITVAVEVLSGLRDFNTRLLGALVLSYILHSRDIYSLKE